MLKAALLVFALGIATTGYGAEPVLNNDHALVVYEATGALQSTSADGKKVVSDYRYGQIRFSPRDHVHSEVLVSGHGHAVIVELK